MSEWNGIIDGMDYDELEYDDHLEEIYQAQMDLCHDMVKEEVLERPNLGCGTKIIKLEEAV